MVSKNRLIFENRTMAVQGRRQITQIGPELPGKANLHSRCVWMLLGLLTLTAACRGPESYLPQPRLPDDEDEAVVVAGPTPTTNPPTTIPNSQNSLPAPPPPSIVSASPPIVNTRPQVVSPTTAPVANPAARLISSSPASVTPIQPRNQLTVVERRRHTIACLHLIAEALERFRAKYRRYPDCYYHSDDQPYLSWRVELLPYLGYGELYKKFNYREPWDSPSNRRLVAEIPPVYQSPERGDERTNFLLAVGQHTGYVGSSGPREDAFPDGLDKTILLVEVDDPHSLPWTKPDDWRVDPSQPRAGVFSLREDGFFVIMGKGAVRQIPNTIADLQLAALWTARGGEAVDIGEWSQVPAEVVNEKLVAASQAIQKSDAKSLVASEVPNLPSNNPASVAGTAAPVSSPSLTSNATRRPVLPIDSEVKSAEALIKQVYGDRYAKAKTLQERREIATTMLTDAESIRHELPSFYTMLRIARDVATNAGDITSARLAIHRLEDTFEMNVVEHRLPWLETANKHALSSTDAALLAEETLGLFEIALEQDAFDECRDLQALFLSLARRSGDQKQINMAPSLRDRIDTARKAYSKIADHLHVLLRSPEDPQANHEVGKYLCFVKGQWETGLAHLSRGSDGPLKQVASLELQRPTTIDAQAILGDTYWSLAEAHYFAADEAALRNRAAYWYRLALPQLPDGLRKALIQERLRTADDMTTLKKNRRHS